MGCHGARHRGALMRNGVLIADLAIDKDPTPDRITVNLGDEAQRRRGRHRRLRNRPGQRRQRDFDRLTVQIRIGDFPAVAETWASLALGADWEPVRVEAPVRRGTTPDGQVADLVDNVIVARRSG